MTIAISDWERKPIQLKFLIGERPLFATSFSALVCNSHYTQLPEAPVEPPEHVAALASDVELLMMRSHPAPEPLPRLLRQPQYLRYVPAQFPRYSIDMCGTFEDYLQRQFRSKSRSTLQRKVRKFAELSGGELKWRCYTRPEEMEEFYQLARSVSQKSYQERLMRLGLPSNERFRRGLDWKAERDLVRGFLLFVEDRPVAYLYCPILDDVLIYEHLGYDPEFQESSPGTVLQYVALERLFDEQRYRVFDFGEGDGQHKEFFSTRSTRCANLYYFRPTARIEWLLRCHSGLSVVSETIVQGLARLGVKSRIKRFFRARA